jgi:molybdate transport system substrate-binding protein
MINLMNYLNVTWTPRRTSSGRQISVLFKHWSLPFLLILLPLFLSSCASKRPAHLEVFAAASLTEAFTEIGATFETANPGMHVRLNLAGSQVLAQQIVQGARADVFASANPQQMAVVIESGRVTADQVFTFATNSLVVALPGGNPAGIQTLLDLAKPGVRLLLAAEAVPAGRYAAEFLTLAEHDPALGPDFSAAARRNIVSYEENVRVVLTKVILGEADAGIVYRSDVSGAGDESLGMIPIPEALNPPVAYQIADLSDTNQPGVARQFLEFVLSDAGSEILRRYGLTPTRAGGG